MFHIIVFLIECEYSECRENENAAFDCHPMLTSALFVVTNDAVHKIKAPPNVRNEPNVTNSRF